MAQQTAPVLVVRNGNWGATSLKGVHGVLASAAGVLLDGFGAAPEAPIHVAPWRPGPASVWPPSALPDADQRPPWRDCARLNLWDAAANRTVADYLDSWAASLRENGLEPRVPSLLAQLFFPARRVSSCPHPRRDDESPHYQSAGLRSPRPRASSGPSPTPAVRLRSRR